MSDLFFLGIFLNLETSKSDFSDFALLCLPKSLEFWFVIGKFPSKWSSGGVNANFCKFWVHAELKFQREIHLDLENSLGIFSGNWILDSDSHMSQIRVWKGGSPWHLWTQPLNSQLALKRIGDGPLLFPKINPSAMQKNYREDFGLQHQFFYAFSGLFGGCFGHFWPTHIPKCMNLEYIRKLLGTSFAQNPKRNSHELAKIPFGFFFDTEILEGQLFFFEKSEGKQS